MGVRGLSINTSVPAAPMTEGAGRLPVEGSPGRRPECAWGPAPENFTFGPVFSLMSGRMLAFAATFFIPVALARIFGQAEFGTYKQAFLIYSTLYYIAQFGMAESLFYFLPLGPRQGGKYVINSLLFLATAGLICLVLLGMTRATISQWLSNSTLSDLMPLMGAYLLLMMVAAVLEIVLMARQRYGWAAWSFGMSDLLRAAFFILPAMATRRLEWLFAGAVAFAALRVGAALYYLGGEFGRELRPDIGLLRQQLAYAGPFGLAVLIEILQSNFHQYAVSYSFDAATFAIYAVGCLQPPFVDFVATPAGNVMMVQMSKKVAEGRAEAVPVVWRDTTRKLALLLVPLVGVQLVAARELIIVLFTPSYLASVPIFMVWSTAILFSAVLTDGVLRVYADTRFLLLLNAIRLLLILALITPLLLEFGLVGAAVATILSMAVTKGIALVRMRRLLQVGVSDLLPWRSLGATAAAAAGAMVPALVLKSQLVLATLPLLVVTMGVYAATYLALLFPFGVLTGVERRAIGQWLQQHARAASRAAKLMKKG